MGKRADSEVLETQMIRNLGELPWLLQFVLTDSNLEWTEAGEKSLRGTWECLQWRIISVT